MRILSSFVSSSTSGQTVLIRLPFNIFIIIVIIFLVVLWKTIIVTITCEMFFSTTVAVIQVIKKNSY